ncbi:MAG: hypothetical protein HYU41_12550 [Candidatus Rokubacteria bacterium]|nr:hypothetical protein [Candidatus Rokubacteria bacterium]
MTPTVPTPKRPSPAPDTPIPRQDPTGLPTPGAPENRPIPETDPIPDAEPKRNT